MSPKQILVKPNALEAAAMLASADPYRIKLNGVLARQDGSLTATDGHALIIVAPDAGLSSAVDDYPALIPDGMHAPSVDGIILPLTSVREAAKAGRKVKSPIDVLKSVAISVNETHGQMVSTDLDTTARTEYRPIAGPYPAIEQVFPKDAPAFRIAFNPDLLAKMMEAMAKASDSKEPRVSLTFYSAEKPVLIENTDGTARGLCMPTVLPKDGAQS
jgi:DNA polymerase III sliding clamp (beta) subunit (PCNA family)